MATYSDNVTVKQEIITIDQDDHHEVGTEEEDVTQFFHFDRGQQEDEEDGEGSNFTVTDWAGEMTQQEVKNELMLDRLIGSSNPIILQFNEDDGYHNFSTRATTKNEVSQHQQQQQQQQQQQDDAELIIPDITGDNYNLVDESGPSTSSLLSSNLKKVQRKSKVIKLNKSIYRSSNRISRRGKSACPSTGRGCGDRIKVLTEKVLKLEIKYLKARIKSLNDRVRWKDDEIARLKSTDNRCSTCKSSIPSQSMADQQQSPQPTLQQHQSLESSEKIKIIQRQISLFLHALQCEGRDYDVDEPCCTMSHCQSAKQVLGHIQSCQLGRNCAIKHCFSSRQILGHFKYCQRADCVLCLPFRQDSVRLSPILNYRTNSPAAATPNSDNHQLPLLHSILNNNHHDNYNNNSNSTSPVTKNSVFNLNLQQTLRHSVSSSSSSSSTITSHHYNNSHHHNLHGMGESDISILLDKSQMTTTRAAATTVTEGSPLISGQSSQNLGPTTASTTTIKTWQEFINPNVRRQVVHRYVKAIFPETSPPQLLLDRRVSNVVTYCKGVEMKIFGSSNSEAEYLSLMAKEIRKTEQQLERKSQLRKKAEQQQQQNQQILAQYD